MKQLILIALLMITATAFAAGKQYYDYPDSPRLYDDARLLVYNNSSGSRNITGAKLKSEINTNPVMNAFINHSTALRSTPPGYWPLDLAAFSDEVDNKLVIEMFTGFDFYLYFQNRIGTMPVTFEPGRWPRAEFRSGRSPLGVVLATYTTTIEDEANAVWALRLSAAQKAALVGKTGYTEQSYADAAGVYHVLNYIPTIVRLNKNYSNSTTYIYFRARDGALVITTKPPL